jgi:hypothetical protein
MHYEILGEPVFRERSIPRLLELAGARAAEDTSVPLELINYQARSRAERERRAQSRDRSQNPRGVAESSGTSGISEVRTIHDPTTSE